MRLPLYATIPVLTALLLASVSSKAGSASYDLNSDPTGLPGFTFVGSAEWVSTGGVNNSGHIKLTDGTGQSCAVLFPDFDAGLVVAAFTFECMIKAGDWYGNPPADGWSVNFARADDPIIPLIEQQLTNPGRGGRTDGWAGSQDNGGTENNLPEEGTQTGIAIGFDTWGTGTAPVGGSNGPQDVRGISVRVDGRQFAQVPMPAVLFPETHDYVNDETTLITGPFTCGPNPANPNFGNPDCGPPAKGEKLNWVPLKVTVDANGLVNVFWKGKRIVSDLQTPYFPSPGRILFGASTGGAMEYAGIDDIKVTTEAAERLVILKVTGSPIGFDVAVTDSGAAVVDPAAAVLKFDDAVVTPTSVSKEGNITTFTYAKLDAPLAANSEHTVSLSIKDTRGQPALNDGVVQKFTVPAYLTVDPSLAIAAVDTTKPGFNVRVHLTANLGQENTVARAEQQLYGLRGANLLSGETVAAEVINFSQEGDTSANGLGAFNIQNGFTDLPIPGIDAGPDQGDPATAGYNNNIAAEITTYIEFSEPGVYQLIFNSDDGFRTTLALNAEEVLSSQLIGQFDGGRGAADTASLLYVTKAGFYGLRSVWFEGGGGANFEWSGRRVAPNSTQRLLLNGPVTQVDLDQDGTPDRTFPAGLKTYRARTGDTPAAVSFVHPARNSGNPYLPITPIIVEIQDGSTAVDQGSIQLQLDGQPVQVSPGKSGNTTTVKYVPPAKLTPGTHKVDIAFTAGGQQYAASNEFTVRTVPVVPPSLALPASAVDKSSPGFLVRTVQQPIGDNMSNDTYRGRTQIARLYGQPNSADLSVFTGPGGYYVEPTVIDYLSTGGGGGFGGNAPVPGIPGDLNTWPNLAGGGTDNYSQEILTVLDLQPGLYVLNVNSDDGFVHAFGNPAEMFTLPLVVGEFSGGRGIGGLGGGTTYFFEVTQAGLYPAQVIWYEGGGGSGIEWTSRGVDANGILAPTSTIVLVNDTSTAGHIKAYQYPLSHGGAPYVKNFSPARTGQASGASPNRVGLNAPISIEIADGGGNIDPNSVTMTVNGTAVAVTAAKNAGVTTATHTPATAWSPGTTYNVVVTFGDRSVRWSFVVGDLPATAFFIEAEDFNYGGGKHKPEASQMPYRGGAYAGEGAVFNVDYNRGNEGASPLYRIGEDPQVPMDRTGDRNRGLVDININFKIGWIGEGQWYNYTRIFPAGQYNVYAGLSHGDGAANTSALRGGLQRVTSSPAEPNQTTASLGTFLAPGTGGWGNNALVPLKDGAGNVVVLDLAGETTLRWRPASGDFDFLLFVPPGAAPPPKFTSITRNAQTGAITVVWEGGGKLEAATSILGPWQEVPEATSPFTFTPNPAQPILFGRIRR
jgi:hypothetical protein